MTEEYLEVVVLPKEGEKAVCPKWMRTLLIFEEGRRIMVPAAASGQHEFLCSMAAGWDGILSTSYRGHVFLPLDWMRREYPDREELWNLMQKNADKAIKEPS